MKKVEQLILLEKTERQNHLNLSEPCTERGGNSTVHQGVLAEYLDTDIPFKRKVGVHLLHACNNDKCSNPRHLYWGTQKENVEDAIEAGMFINAWEATVMKYGEEKSLEMIRSLQKTACSLGGKALKGRKFPGRTNSGSFPRTGVGVRHKNAL